MMKTAAKLLVPFLFISVAALVLNEGSVHAGRVLKRNDISTQTHKDPSDNPNLLIQEVEVAQSGPNPGGNKVTQSISQGLILVHDDKLNIRLQKGPNPSDHNPNLLVEEVEVARSGPNPGGNSVTQSISGGLNLQFQKGPFDTNNQRLSE